VIISQVNRWFWPLRPWHILVLAITLALVSGWTIDTQLHESVRQQLTRQLRSKRDASVATLKLWSSQHEAWIGQTVAKEAVQDHCIALMDGLSKPESVDLALMGDSADCLAIRDTLEPILQQCEVMAWALLNTKGDVVFTSQPLVLGNDQIEIPKDRFEKVLNGLTVSTPPIWSPFPISSSQDNAAPAKFCPSLMRLQNASQMAPVIFVMAPIAKKEALPKGALAIMIDPSVRFSKLLEPHSDGIFGETYAFDGLGRLVTVSRFERELQDKQILKSLEEGASLLTTSAKVPRNKFMDGTIMAQSASTDDLTEMADDAIRGGTGIQLDGYRNYMGNTVAGAWTWLEDLNVGVASEIPLAEAYQEIDSICNLMWFLIGSGTTIASSLVLASFASKRDPMYLEGTPRQLGSYRLVEVIGAGGMGTVYRGVHELIRRDVAIKVLEGRNIPRESIQRFEREAQATAALCHPNTINIFDFGQSKTGEFFYAMELVEGTDLAALVRRHGPLPPARVIYILRQVCGSLLEAHTLGMIHRDIKPSNIILFRRPGLCDFVKVLDFGLVKNRRQQDLHLTQEDMITGTPHFMSPEAIRDVSSVTSQSDVYSLGAVAYYLLTSNPVFSDHHSVAICMKHLRDEPRPPSQLLSEPLPADLEALVLRMLAKSPDDRPPGMRCLIHELNACVDTNGWDEERAASWWADHGEGESESSAVELSGK
jgi:hypothetical protein